MCAFWNPWHGCTKISPGCKYCYVYRNDRIYGAAKPTSECRKTAAFTLPVKKSRDGSLKIPSGSMVFTCFTSDFLLEDADEWRPEAWNMMRTRPDLTFFFYTKRILRLKEVLPPDWGAGYENVIIGCTVENQKMADLRLPEFLRLPIRHRTVGVEPMLERIDLSAYLCPAIGSVSAGGESGPQARICDYGWVLDLREQCVRAGIPFSFHQTGSNFVYQGKTYHVPRKYQEEQAAKAGIDT